MAALGRPGYMTLGHADDLNHKYDEASMERHAHEVLDAAWRLGIRYFDNARSYGLGEKFLSTWLASRRIQPNEITIASKWGYTYTAGWQVKATTHEVKDHTLPVLQRQWKESAELLGNYLHVYQIHSTTLETGVLNDAAVMRELARLKTSGVHIGLTLTGAEQWKTLQRAMTVKVDGVAVFDNVQATWNLLEPSVSPALADAHAAGFGVVVKEALANGRLTDRNTAPAFARQLQLLRTEAQRLGCSIDALALASCLAQPFVHVVLSGAATVPHVTSNVAAIKVRIDAETLERLKPLAQPAAEYWLERKSLEWN